MRSASTKKNGGRESNACRWHAGCNQKMGPRHVQRAARRAGGRAITIFLQRVSPVVQTGPSNRSVLAYRNLWNLAHRADYSGLRLANLTTLPHFSVSVAMNWPNSAGAVGNTVEPSSAYRPLITGSARAVLISRLS